LIVIYKGILISQSVKRNSTVNSVEGQLLLLWHFREGFFGVETFQLYLNASMSLPWTTRVTAR
jgi:hypothetical protein